MRYAAEVSSKAHELAMAASKEGIHEFQIQSIIEGFLFMEEPVAGHIHPLSGAVKTQQFFTIL